MTEPVHERSRSAWLRRAEALALIAVALACLAFQLRVPGFAVPDGDFRAVAEVLRREAAPGDAVVLFPWWTERARLFVPPELPVVGYLGVEGDPLREHPGLWLLAQPELPRARLERFMERFGPERTAQGQARRFGNLSLQRFENRRARPSLFRSAELLGEARVVIEHPDDRRDACALAGRAHRCPGGVVVDTQWHELDYAPRRCTRLPPPGGASRTVLELRAPRAAQALELVTGYIWDRGHFRTDVATVSVGVEVDGVAQTVALPPGEHRLQRVELQGVAEGGTIRLWTQASNPRDRDVCVELAGLGGAP